MSKIRNFFNHCYHAVRYGKWYFGWEGYEGKPMLGIFKEYYDGNLFAFHCYKFYIEVHY